MAAGGATIASLIIYHDGNPKAAAAAGIAGCLYNSASPKVEKWIKDHGFQIKP
jgi:hypothetical protein